MTTQPTQATAMTRDPHLPPAAVVDWLLEQTWPGEIPETRIDYLGGNPTGVAGSTLLGWQQAYVDIGANAGGRIFLDSDALGVLRKDHAIRQAALEEKRQTCDLDSEALAWLQHASNSGCGDLVLQHLLQQMMRLQKLKALEQQRADEGGIMSIFHLLRQLRLYALAQRLVPFPLPASERELRRWDALGEAYGALLEIKHADNLQAAREFAGAAADRVRDYCCLP